MQLRLGSSIDDFDVFQRSITPAEPRQLPPQGGTTNSTGKPRTKPKWWWFGLLGLMVLAIGFFAWRYFKAKKSTNAINIIAWISIGAIIIGTAALILVLSVFNGFEGLVKDLYSSFYTDLKVSPASGKIITVTPEQLLKLRSLIGKKDSIKIFSLVVEEKALLQNGENQSVVYLKGVDENYRYTTGVADHLIVGEYDLGNEELTSLRIHPHSQLQLS